MLQQIVLIKEIPWLIFINKAGLISGHDGIMYVPI